MKILIAALVCLPMISQAGLVMDQALKEVGAQAQLLNLEKTADLRAYEERLSKMTETQLRLEKGLIGAKKKLSCLASDALIATAAVGESIPVGNALVKLIAQDVHDDESLRRIEFMALKGDASEKMVEDAKRVAGDIFDLTTDLELGTVTVTGGFVASVGIVIIEGLTSFDSEKISERIRTKFPATQVIAHKVSGENSLCGERQIKHKMVSIVLDAKK